MLVVGGGLALAQVLLSDKLALRAIGARQVSAREAPDLHAIFERLCVQADLPKPRIAIAEMRAAPNHRGRPPRREAGSRTARRSCGYAPGSTGNAS
jgi:Zn-dependent protease with chaperone function